MTRCQVLQEIRRMRFEEAYGGWQSRRLTQEEAARLLGVCERTACPRGSGGSGATWTATRTRGWTGSRTSAWGRSRRVVLRSMRWCAPRRCPGSTTRVERSTLLPLLPPRTSGHAQLHLGEEHPSGSRAGDQGSGPGLDLPRSRGRSMVFAPVVLTGEHR